MDENQNYLKRLFGKEVDPMVFYLTIALTVPFVVMGLFMPEQLAKVSNAMVGGICHYMQSIYLLGVTAFLLFCIALGMSPLGKIKLGKDDEKPEFSTISWFSMLFSAGMGIGLLFWSIAEPMSHMANPPMGEAGTREAAKLAQEIYFFHWGFHAWAIYAVVGLCLAYFNFRKNRGSLVSGCLVPIFGEKACNGLFGKIVDTFAVWATLFGVVTGLGTGAMQMTGGLSYLFGFANTPAAVAVVITFITICFVISAITGIGRGIKFLSNLNIVLMLILFVFFLIFGPTSFLFKNFGATISAYLMDLPKLSFSTVLFENEGWTRGWTVFYWAFWIAWAPFVGGFIARVSRGRTIREFIFMVLFAPAVFSFVFSTVIGGTGIYLDLFQGTAIGKVALELSLYETLKQMPLSIPMSIVGVLLATSFVITSADSATYVMARLCTKGQDASDAKAGNRLTIVWGVLLGVLTIGFSFSGGLNGLKAATIIGSVPFIIIMFLCIVALVMALLKEKTVPGIAPEAEKLNF
ncbi:glycine betaine transporter [Desulfocicer vacuolatum DSM 3385]|uniref:Glycine betaine transporter n=1 Tax=Desulfocicer vacuolatum DSM 3385 TaxID=1121400 RepID=A0A1W2A7B6_9BACT|nr:BCCT family transporter [Desulfocicer vacuolatum]SMC56362.1 glycine betaine transporter [Desulfocicer vacuolatum DSM 3385]